MQLPATTKLNKFASMSRRGLMRGTLLMLVYLFGGHFSGSAQVAWQTEAFALSSDGRFVAASFKPDTEVNHYRVRDGGIWLYDLENVLSPARYLMESRYAEIDLVFSPDSAFLAAIDHTGLYVFRADDGGQVFQLQRPIAHWLAEASDRIEFSPDSQYVKSFNIYDAAESGGELAILVPIWDLTRGRRILVAETRPVDQWTIVRFSPDWEQIVFYDQIFAFDIETGMGELIGTLEFGVYPGYGDDRGELFHERRPLFATATHDCIVQIYDTRSWTVSKSWHDPDSDCEYGIGAVDFGHDKPWLAFSDLPGNWQRCESLEEARLVVWDYDDDIVVFEAATHASNFRFTPDDRFIVASGCRAGYGDAQISVWDSESDFAFRAYPGATPQLHPNSELMVTIGHDGQIWIWNLVLGTPMAILPAIPS